MPGELTNNPTPDNPQKPDIPLIVKISVGGKVEEINLLAINHLFSDLKNYNDQFSTGKVITRGLFSMMFDEDDQIGESLKKEGEDQQITTSTLSAIHQNTLNKIGLTIEPITGGATFYAGGEEASAVQMGINIQDRNKFTPFLHALQPVQVQEIGLKPILESLTGKLAAKVLEANLNEPSDEVLQLFGGLGKIVDEYKRLGMTPSVKTLETYLEHARQGDLKEFVSIERWNYLSEPGRGRGPEHWDGGDMSPESVAINWDAALNTLVMTRDNTNAQQLYKQLGPHLLSCISIARENLKGYKITEYYPQHLKDKIDKVLEEVEERLKSITADQNPTSPQQQLL